MIKPSLYRGKKVRNMNGLSSLESSRQPSQKLWSLLRQKSLLTSHLLNLMTHQLVFGISGSSEPKKKNSLTSRKTNSFPILCFPSGFNTISSWKTAHLLPDLPESSTVYNSRHFLARSRVVIIHTNDDSLWAPHTRVIYFGVCLRWQHNIRKKSYPEPCHTIL